MRIITKYLGASLHIFNIAITIIAAISLIFTYVACWVNPNDLWWISFFGLITPLVVVINAVIMLLWTIRWSRWALVPSILLLFGTGIILRQVQPPIFKKYEMLTPTFKVMSYNVHIFRDKNWQSSVDSVLTYIKEESPDIVCIQEFSSTADMSADSISSILGDYPYRHINYTSFYDALKLYGYGTAIFSKHKIINDEEVHFAGEVNSAQYVDISIDSDTLRIFNCHLQTTNIDGDDKELFNIKSAEQNISNMQASWIKAKQIIGKLEINNKKRANQAYLIDSLVRASPYRVILAGDFNDVPVSYTYSKIKGSLGDSFKKCGRGYAGSFKEFGGILNIDYIFYNKELKNCAYQCLNKPWSDHKPIMAEFELIKK